MVPADSSLSGSERLKGILLENPKGVTYVVEGDGFVLFQCGDFKGTTIVKKVEVWDVTNGPINAIKAVKTITPANGAIYNLAGQKVDASYKGIVIMNGKKYLQK